MANYIDILPKMDASVARYADDFCCQECGNSGIGYPDKDKPKLIGYCETPLGYMMIAECQHCFDKFRFHGTVCDKFDLFEFEHAIRCYNISKYFCNSEELKKEKQYVYNKSI